MRKDSAQAYVDGAWMVTAEACGGKTPYPSERVGAKVAGTLEGTFDISGMLMARRCLGCGRWHVVGHRGGPAPRNPWGAA